MHKLFEQKIISDKPFVEKKIPEYPCWMKQPTKDEDVFDYAITKRVSKK